MKKTHAKTLKLHTIYNISIGLILVGVIIFKPDFTLLASTVFLLLYVVGNGIIHLQNNELKRDTCLEYIILSVVVFVIIISTVWH